MKKGGLGKGLDSLISKKMENVTKVDVSRETLLRVAEIEPNKEQPRYDFDEEKIDELAKSIEKHGILQPLIVVDRKGYYQIVAGERRWRAAKKLGLTKVPVIIKEYDQQSIDEIALIENIQRENLNPVEEARGIKKLMEDYEITQEQVAQVVSKSRSYIANIVRLLKLPKEVLDMIQENKLSVGHARALITINDEEKIIEIANKVIEENLNVREIEKLLQKKDKGSNIYKKDTAIEKTEKDLENLLKTKVLIKNNVKNKGKIEISYQNLEELERLIELITGR